MLTRDVVQWYWRMLLARTPSQTAYQNLTGKMVDLGPCLLTGLCALLGNSSIERSMSAPIQEEPFLFATGLLWRAYRPVSLMGRRQ
jgi:hypothetical protein